MRCFHFEQLVNLVMRDNMRRFVMTPEEFAAAYPKMLAWIQKTLAYQQKDARSIASMQFTRLPLYFAERTLQTTKFILLDRVPIPPLSTMGLARFAAFEQGNFDGITYLDTYFLRNHAERNEALHFHELIHVDCLGRTVFLLPTLTGWSGSGMKTALLRRWLMRRRSSLEMARHASTQKNM
jgi:hypothetical protein